MIAIVDYGSSNLRSVAKSFEMAGAKNILITSSTLELQKCDSIILPGQGAFADGMGHLKKNKLIPVIQDLAFKKKVPVLGICLGMQLLATIGYENGENEGLGLISGKTLGLKIDRTKFKLPHVGWDDITIVKSCPLLKDLPNNSNFYFVHSYFFKPDNQSVIAATCDYGDVFPVVVYQNNIFATLFHPEKSLHSGQIIIRNFLKYKIC